jgi:hypothetical protein
MKESLCLDRRGERKPLTCDELVCERDQMNELNVISDQLNRERKLDWKRLNDLWQCMHS